MAGIPANSSVRGLDEDGTVLVDVEGDPWPNIWRNGVCARLAALPSATGADPLDIANGRVVGRATLANGDSVGVLWDTEGVPRELPSSYEGTLINRNGLIGGVQDPATRWGAWRLRTPDGTIADY